MLQFKYALYLSIYLSIYLIKFVNSYNTNFVPLSETTWISTSYWEKLLVSTFIYLQQLKKHYLEVIILTVWKVSLFRGFLVHIFLHSDSRNAGKHGPEKLQIRTLSTQCLILKIILIYWNPLDPVNRDYLENFGSLLKIVVNTGVFGAIFSRIRF